MNSPPIKNASSENEHKLNQETDRQMLTRIGKRFAFILVFIFMFDTLFDWFLGVMDLMLEGIHILIEAVEYSIELILEYTLQTNHQYSEMIIVNGAILISLFVIYRFYLAIPRLYSKLTQSYCLYLKRKSTCWNSTPLIRKIKVVSAYCIGIACVLFVVTL